MNELRGRQLPQPCPQWQLRNPKIIESQLLQTTVQFILRNKKIGSEDIVRSAKALHSAFPKPTGPKEILEQVIDIYASSASVAVKAFGLKYDARLFDRLQSAYIWLMVNDLKSEFEPLKAFIKDTMGWSKRIGDEQPAVCYKLKIWQFCNIAHRKLYGMDLARSMNPLAVELMERTISELDGNIVRDMAAEMIALRKYGVKTAFFESGIRDKAGQCVWLFVDPVGFGDYNTPYGAPQMPFGEIYMALKSTVMSKREIEIVSKKPEYHEAMVHRPGPNVRTGLHLTLNQDGELDLSQGHGLLSLRKIFREEGRESAYVGFQLAHLMRLYDLVVPITVVSRMPELSHGRGLIGRILGAKPKPLTPDLIIPRVRSLEDMNRLREELERELDQAETETIARAKREMREHDVVSHVRRLTQGYRASGHAVAAAAEYGIRLAENETFVKKHKRGSGEHVGVHRARERPLILNADQPDG